MEAEVLSATPGAQWAGQVPARARRRDPTGRPSAKRKRGSRSCLKRSHAFRAKHWRGTLWAITLSRASVEASARSASPSTYAVPIKAPSAPIALRTSATANVAIPRPSKSERRMSPCFSGRRTPRFRGGRGGQSRSPSREPRLGPAVALPRDSSPCARAPREAARRRLESFDRERGGQRERSEIAVGGRPCRYSSCQWVRQGTSRPQVRQSVDLQQRTRLGVPL